VSSLPDALPPALIEALHVELSKPEGPAPGHGG